MVVGGCSTTPTLEKFDADEVSVGEEELFVALASTATERSQGLSGLTEIPEGIDGMLFSWDEPTSTSFHMRDVGFPLDVWWFDADGSLIGSARMEPCVEDECPSYSTPGPIMWALETPADVRDFDPGVLVSNVEKG